MFRRAIIGLFLLLAIFASLKMKAQVTLGTTVSACIVKTITLTKLNDLNFGNLAVTGSSGSCVLTPAGGTTPPRNTTGGVTLPSFTGTTTAAAFTVTGVEGEIFVIQIPPDDLTILNGTAQMTVNAYTTDQTVLNPGSSWYGVLGSSGTTFYVGATVNVQANQTPGIYENLTGFPVTVNYQ